MKTVKVQVASAEGRPGSDRRLLPERLTTSTGSVIDIDWVTGRSGRNGSESSCIVLSIEAAVLGSMYSQAAVSLFGELCSSWTVRVKSFISGTRGGALKHLASAWKVGQRRLRH